MAVAAVAAAAAAAAAAERQHPLPPISDPRRVGEIRRYHLALFRQRCAALGLEQPSLQVAGDVHELTWKRHPSMPTITVQDTGTLVRWDSEPPYASQLFLREAIDEVLSSDAFAPARRP